MDAAMLNELESQHREVERVLAELAEAKEADEQRPLVEELAEMLSRHMEIEESDVYPELRAFDAEMADEGVSEHDLIRDGLQNMQEMIGAPGFGAAVDMVESGISHHVEEEESEAFPLLRRELGLEGSGASRSSARSGGSGRSGSGGSGGSDEPTKAELYERAKEKGIEGRSTMSKDDLAKALGER
ncbi:MAG: hemerythrin domain-containing protein [Acidimicrobiales bacterium]